jgi:hypothetical protein
MSVAGRSVLTGLALWFRGIAYPSAGDEDFVALRRRWPEMLKKQLIGN